MKRKALIIFDAVLIIAILAGLIFKTSINSIRYSITESTRYAENSDKEVELVATADKLKLKKGESTTVKLRIENIHLSDDGLNSIVGYLSWNENIFDEVDIREIGDWHFEQNRDKNHRLYGKFVAYTMNEGVKEKQDIVEITLKLKDDVEPQKTEIALTGVKSSEGDIAVNCVYNDVDIEIVKDEDSGENGNEPGDNTNNGEDNPSNLENSEKDSQNMNNSTKTGDEISAIAWVLIIAVKILIVLVVVKDKKREKGSVALKLGIVSAVIFVVVSICALAVISFANENVDRSLASELDYSEEWLNSNEYLVTDGEISRILPNTEKDAFVTKFNKQVEFENDGAIFLGENNLVATGMEITDGQDTYFASVWGDTNGDGESNQVDLAQIIRCVVSPAEFGFSGVEKLSADMNVDSRINEQDVMKAVRYILYEEISLPELASVSAPKIEVIEGTYNIVTGAYDDTVKLKISRQDGNATKMKYKVEGTENRPYSELEDGSIIVLSNDGVYKVSAYNYGKSGNRSQIPYIIVTKKNSQKSYKVITRIENADGTYEETTEDKTGKIGDIVVVGENIPEGYEINESSSILSGTINENENLELVVTLDRKLYNLKLNVGNFISSVQLDGIENSSAATKKIKFGKMVNISAVLESQDGYTTSFDRWISSDRAVLADISSKDAQIEMPMSDIELTAVANRIGNADTTYTVEYYYQVNGEYSDVADETRQRSAETGVEVQVTEDDKTSTRSGYVCDNAKVADYVGTVAGNGSLKLKVYFKQQFAVTYKAGEHGYFKVGEEHKTEEKYEGLDYNVAMPALQGEIIADAGYTFAGWDEEPAENVTENKTYTAMWTANELSFVGGTLTEGVYGTEYVSEAFDVASNGTGNYTYSVKSCTLNGVSVDAGHIVSIDGENGADRKIRLISNTPAGTYNVVVTATDTETGKTTDATFVITINKQVITAVTDVTVGADGIVNWSNSNNATAYEISFDGENYETVSNGANYLNRITETAGTKTIYVRAVNSDNDNYETENSSVASIEVTVCAVSVSSNNTEYGTVDTSEFNVISGATYVISENELKVNAGLTVLKTVTASKIDADGYTTTFDGWSVENGTISENTSITANFTRTANNNTKYHVEHYLENLDSDDSSNPDNYTLKESIELPGTTATEAVATENDYIGFTFDGANTNNVVRGDIAGDEGLVLKLYYTRNSYDLTLTNDENIATVIGAGRYKFGAEVTVNATLNEITGYTITFVKWESSNAELLADKTTKEATFTMPAGAVELKAISNKTADEVNYTVETYYQENGTYKGVADETETRQAETDTQVQVLDTDKQTARTGYVFDESKTEALSGTVQGNGSLVLKVYFKQQFIVTYSSGAHGSFKVGTEQKTEVKYEGLDYNSLTPAFQGEITPDAGYTFAGWNEEIAEKVTENKTYTAEWNGNDLVFEGATLNSGVYGTEYVSEEFNAASNGAGNYTYSIKSGAPDGATIDGENGARRKIRFLSTTPAGEYDIVVTVTDTATEKTKDARFEITINKQTINPVTNLVVSTAGVVTWSPSSNATSYEISFDGENYVAATSGSDYSETLTATAGTKTVYVKAINSDTANYALTSEAIASTTVSVYNVTVSKVTGVEAVTGAGNYISETTVTVSATVSEGYLWNKWLNTVDNTTVSTDNPYEFTVNENIELTADALAQEFTVTFDANGGKIDVDGEEVNTINKTYTYNSVYGELPTPSREGYSFEGWSNSLNYRSLPNEYQGVEYIGFNGAPYIDTGIIPTNHTTEVEFDFEEYENDEFLFGTSRGAWYYHFTTYENNYYYGGNGNDQYAGIWSTGNHTLVYNDVNNSVILDNVHLVENRVFSSDKNLLIGARDNASHNLRGKIYYFKITDKETGNLVRDYIPCYRKSDGVIGFYDTVTDMFYANNGTGTFTKGKDISKIDSSMVVANKNHTLYAIWKKNEEVVRAVTNLAVSTAGVVTWDASTNATSYEISFDGENYVAATSGSDYSETLTAIAGTKTIYVKAINSDTANYVSTSESITNITVSVFSVILNKATGIEEVAGAGNYINGATVSLSATASEGYVWSKWQNTVDDTTVSTDNPYEFEVNENVNLTANATAQEFIVTFDANGGKIDVDGEEVSTINKTYTYNAVYGELTTPTRTGYTFKGWKNNALPEEYQAVEYIESTGSQYIDTGYYANINTKIELEAMCTDTRTQSIYEQITGGVSRYHDSSAIQIAYNINQECVVLDYGTANAGAVSVEKNTKFKVILENGSASINGISGNQQGIFAGRSSYSLYIFDNNLTGYTEQNFRGRIYSYKIYENDVLVRNYLPCYRKSDNVVGLYDVVNNTFYSSKTSNNFIAGSDIRSLVSAEDIVKNENHTLYAVWEKDVITIVYDGNGATSGEMENSTIAYGESENLTSNGFTNKYIVNLDANDGELSSSTLESNCTFENWSTDNSENNVLYQSDAEINNRNDLWEQQTEFVQCTDLAPYFDEYGCDKLYNINLDLKSENTSGFNSIDVYFMNYDSSKYSYPDRKAIEVSTEYKNVNINDVISLEKESDTMAMLALYGGYYTGNYPVAKNVKLRIGACWDDGYEVSYGELSQITSNKNIRLYAKWKAQAVTLPTPTKDGYVFDGWYSDESFGNKVGNGGDLYTPTGNTYLYAKWEQVTNVKYAVQIYGINQDVDENDNPLGLTFGPATGADYNNSYVTHEYEEITDNPGNYNVKVVTHTVAANGSETTTSAYLTNSSGNNVTRTEAQVIARENISLHDMTWAEIAAVSDKTVFEDCMLCGDTKSVSLALNSTVRSGSGYNQYGDGAGTLYYTVKSTTNAYYRVWNPSSYENAAATNGENNGSNARNEGGYSTSHIRATLIGENANTDVRYAGDVNSTTYTCLYSCIESDLQAVIVPKKIKYLTGTSTSNYSANDDIADSIWLLSDREMYDNGQYYNTNKIEGLGANGDGYDKFGNTESKYYISSYNNSSNRKRTTYNEQSSTLDFWLRTPTLDDTRMAMFVGNSGEIGNRYTAGDDVGLSFGFCI